MASVQVCALFVLLAAVVTADPLPESLKDHMLECGKTHNVADPVSKEVLHGVNPDYSCFYACVMKKAKENVQEAESPKMQVFLKCHESSPKTGEECADALEIKKCIVQHYHSMDKKEQ